MRKIVLVPLLLVILVVAAGAGVLGWSYLHSRHDLAGKIVFREPLAVPPLARSTVVDGRRIFDLTLERGHHDFGERHGVSTYGVNGGYLGPTVRVRDGEKIGFAVHNRLGRTSTLHWHGMHLPADMDGGPHQMVPDGSTWRPHWTVKQPQATLWYHPHPHEVTAEQIYRGLAGMLIVDPADPAEEERLGLPHVYGVDDVPLIVQDRKFDGNQLDTGSGLFASTGVLGTTIAVDGTVGPYLDVGTERVRLRLLNASNARIYTFHLDDERRFAMVASDGGLLRAPLPLRRLTLSPGERAEIVVTMRPGERTVLQSGGTKVGSDALQQRWSGGDDSFDIVQLRAAARLAPSPPVAAHLAELPDAGTAGASRTRSFDLSGTSINGRDMNMNRIDARIPLGETELWRVHNTDSGPHNFHVHDAQFRVVRYDGSAAPAQLRGRKDTVFLPAGASAVLRIRFEDYTDPDTPYMFHCHLLRHEDAGMMGQFVVVRPGEPVGD